MGSDETKDLQAAAAAAAAAADAAAAASVPELKENTRKAPGP